MNQKPQEPLIIVHHELKKFCVLLFYSAIAAGKFTILDLVTKWLAKSTLTVKPGMVASPTSFLDFVYSWNKGISFSLFDNYEHANKIFIAISIIIIIYIWKLLLDAPNYRIYKGYTYIIGGAMGNLFDRILNGAVFDFIAFHYNDIYFPAFNIADALITIGAIIVIWQYYKIAKAVAKKKESEYTPLAAEADRIRKLDAEIAKKGIKRDFKK